jgi:nucleoid-associated protein YgaU
MGLFDFLKNSGPKILDKKEEEKIANSTPEVSTKAKVDAMTNSVNKLNLPVENLSIMLNDDVVTVFCTAESQYAKELVVLTLGNHEDIARVDDRMTVVKAEPEATFYEVKSGDTLSKIAKAQYGDASKYNLIFEANTPMLKDPDKIYPGQKLRIPQA